MAGTITGYKDRTLKQSVVETSFADELVGDQVRGCEDVLMALVNKHNDLDMYISWQPKLTMNSYKKIIDYDGDATLFGRGPIIDATEHGMMIEEMPNPLRMIKNRKRIDNLEKHIIIKLIDGDKLINSLRNKKDCWEIGTKYFADKCAHQTVTGEPTAFEGLGEIREQRECIEIPDRDDQKGQYLFMKALDKATMMEVEHHEEAHWNMQMNPRNYLR